MPNLLVISDLHCTTQGSSSETSFLRPDSLRGEATRHPVEALLKLKREKSIVADLLICPGDVADKVDRLGFVHGVSLLVEISDEFNCREHIATIGNHDVESRRGVHTSSSDPFYIPKNVHPSKYPFENASLHDTFWERGVVIHEYDDITIVNINTVRYAADDAHKDRGIVTAEQCGYLRVELEKIKEKLASTPWIALCHHHPIQHEIHSLGSEDLMKDGETLVNLLLEFDCDLVVHGHKHHTRLTHVSRGANRLPVFSAGSFSHHLYAELRQFTSNTFHMISLREKGRGVITNWRFLIGHGWMPTNMETCGVEHNYGFSRVSCYPEVKDQVLNVLKDRCAAAYAWGALAANVPDLVYLDYDEIGDLQNYIEANGFCLYRKGGLPFSFHPAVPCAI